MQLRITAAVIAIAIVTVTVTAIALNRAIAISFMSAWGICLKTQLKKIIIIADAEGIVRKYRRRKISAAFL